MFLSEIASELCDGNICQAFHISTNFDDHEYFWGYRGQEIL